MPGPGSSPAERWCHQLVELGGDLDDALSGLSVVEQAALAYCWAEWWARPEQLLPEDRAWRAWGACTGRRWGKTRAIAEWVHGEAMSGRAMRIALIAQNAEQTHDVMVAGESGLLAVAPPWERPIWEGGRLTWPNGAQAFPHTPEAPGDLRGPGFYLAWASEMVSWPRNKLREAWSNLQLMTSLGYARTVWDTTPKRRHPLIRDLLARSERAPRRHVVVRGKIRDNVANINPDQIEELERDLAGTTRGREELDGEYIDELGATMVQQAWIDEHRRSLPARLERRALGIDPATTTNKDSDATGMIEGGLAAGVAYIITDHSQHYPWEEWGRVAIDLYLGQKLDCITIETNRGGEACVANLRTAARASGAEVQVVDAKTTTRHNPRIVYVKTVNSSRTKGSRLEPVAPLYQRGQVVHVAESDLTVLEEQLTTWEDEPGAQSPDALDAAVHLCWDLMGLSHDRVRNTTTAAGLAAVRAALKTQQGSSSIATISPISTILRTRGRENRL